MITVATVLDKRYRLFSGNFRIKTRVTFPVIEQCRKKWIIKYYPTRQEASEIEFSKIQKTPRSLKLKVLKMEIDELEQKAHKIVKAHPLVSIEKFEEMFIHNINPMTNLSTKVTELTIAELESVIRRVVSETLSSELLKPKQQI